MPRIRSIHYDAWKSEKLAHASDGAERCYWRIQPYMDDQGRGEDHPKLMAATCFPLRDEVTAEVMDEWLCELDRLGLVVRYEADGLRLVQIQKWSNYQHPQKPKRSDFPPPPAHSGRSTRQVPDANGTGSSRSGVEGSGSGEGTGDGEGEGVAPNNRFTRGLEPAEHPQVVDMTAARLSARAARFAGGSA
jgi:hypothetical protein